MENNQSEVQYHLVKDYVKANIKAANVFEKYGIDFCCKGNRPITEVCKENNIEINQVLDEISNLDSTDQSKNNQRFDEWELTFLMDYIVNNHHKFVRNMISQLTPHLEKVTLKHGNTYPYLNEVESLFKEVTKDMVSHMDKEEKMLFPIIKYLKDCEKFEEKPKTNGYGTIITPIEVMETEHTNAGDAMEKIKILTNNFTPPADACNTFQLTYSELSDFEKDLHIHVHLENNILFPKAILLEKELTSE